MPNKVAVDQQAKGMIIELGLLIRDCRGTLSQSQLAKRVGLPRSNMKYIEDGVNAPTAEVYDKLIKELKPDLQTRQRMDRLYMAIRKVPPPDICRTITQNKDLVDAMRKLEGCNLTPKPPVDDPVFLRFTKSLTDEYQNLRENRNKNDIYGMTKSMSKDFPFEDIERISAWLRYLISNPDSAESRSVVEPIMDMEEQFKTRTNWICRCKNKVRKICVETFRSSTTTTLARELTTPESSEDMERAEKRVKDSRMGKKK